MSNHVVGRRRFITIAASALGAAALGGVRPVRAAEPARWRGSALGAQVSIDIHHPDRAAAIRLIETSVADVRRLERQFSLYRADSAICELNRAGVLVAPDPDMVELLRMSLKFAELTDGAFDPTVQPLWRLYQAHFGKPDADPAGPSAEKLAAALSRVSFRNLKVSEERVALTMPGAAITLNGIAQGYATDRVVERLRRAGIKAALVDIGEIGAIGRRPDGAPWHVALSAPEEMDAAPGSVDLIDRAIATSAGAGFHFDRRGRFTHLFDPANGRSPSLYRSVSVVAATASEADALSTAFSIMESARIAAILKIRPGVQVQLVHRGGTRETLQS